MTRGDLLKERYKLDAPLGRGGMAEVWRAIDERLGRPVAIKVLANPIAAQPENLVRFFTEAQQLARISHPNVVRVLDFGDADGAPFLVMEFVPGGSVADLTGEPMDPDRAARLVENAARGAAAAHAIDLIHRDIKPANILLDEDGTPKLADFGIAMGSGQEKLTATGTAIGSPQYISPEQASGRPVVPASDVYSLGVVLYELVSGRRPFEADSAMALAIAHVEKEPPPLDVPGIDPELVAIVMRSLEKDPERRFTDGGQLAEALSGSMPAFVPPPVTSVDLGGTDEIAATAAPTRRGRGRAAFVAIAAAAIAIVLLGAFVFGRGVQEERVAAAPRAPGSRHARHEARHSPRPTTSARPVSPASPTTRPSASPTTANQRNTRTVNSRDRSKDQVRTQPQSSPSPQPTATATSQPTSDPSPSSSP
ncbi:MAG TPA: serine/threonine-protein kinase [Actinomycetota bacterium]|nr:serine/threonine-protein kinase [Actinomycetota bacterium]